MTSSPTANPFIDIAPADLRDLTETGGRPRKWIFLPVEQWAVIEPVIRIYRPDIIRVVEDVLRSNYDRELKKYEARRARNAIYRARRSARRKAAAQA